MPVTAEEFRKALACFASGVTVVTCRDAQGRDWGLTVSAFSSLSLAPPLVLVCIDRRASIHDLLGPGDNYAVNVLAADQEAVSRQFAARGPDRFAGIAHRPGATGAPLIDGALAHVECRITDAFAQGDHTIFVGQVLHSSAAAGQPLLYFRGSYARLG